MVIPLAVHEEAVTVVVPNDAGWLHLGLPQPEIATQQWHQVPVVGQGAHVEVGLDDGGLAANPQLVFTGQQHRVQGRSGVPDLLQLPRPGFRKLPKRTQLRIGNRDGGPGRIRGFRGPAGGQAGVGGAGVGGFRTCQSGSQHTDQHHADGFHGRHPATALCEEDERPMN